MNTTIISRTMSGLILLSALAGLTGCVSPTTSTPAGTVVYAYRHVDATLAEDYTKVVEAARQAIQALEFSKVSENKDAFVAVLEAHTALDKEVEITVTNTGKNLTNIKIRVGTLGDQGMSLAILDKIKAKL